MLAPRQMVALIFGVGAAVALLVAAWSWGPGPEYRVLYSNLSDRDGGAVVAALGQMNVPYKFSEGGGAIMVPASQLYDARLKLASQGLPKGSAGGFELIENPRLGLTQFQEQVHYQRALEGELARTIQTLAAVQSARVHLAIPKSSAFLRDRQKPSASVLLTLYPGKSLERAQVQGIVHLLATSVPELPVKSVSVLDQSGALLSAHAHADATGTVDPGKLAYAQQVEARYIQRIIDILEPITGPNNIRAQVTVEIDFSHTEQTAETYKPNQDPKDATMRSQQTSESRDAAGAAGPGGVPGPASNQPPGTAPTPAIAAAAATQSGSARRDSTINYEVDKTVRLTRQPVGQVKRLSAAVVVNHKKVTNDKGETKPVPLEQAELDQITALVKESIGFQQERGDSLNVTNAAFTVVERAPDEEIAFWKAPDTVSLAKETGKQLLFAALALWVLLGVLRPMFRSVNSAIANAPAAPALAQIEGQSSASIKEALESARLLARQDPKVVATVVKGWIGKNE